MKRPSRNTVWLIFLTLWIFFGFTVMMIIVMGVASNNSDVSVYDPSTDIERKHNIRLVSQHDIDICDLKLATELITEAEHSKCVIRGQTSQNIYGKVGESMDYQREYPSFQDHLEMKASERNQTVTEYVNELLEK